MINASPHLCSPKTVLNDNADRLTSSTPSTSSHSSSSQHTSSLNRVQHMQDKNISTNNFSKHNNNNNNNNNYNNNNNTVANTTNNHNQIRNNDTMNQLDDDNHDDNSVNVDNSNKYNSDAAFRSGPWRAMLEARRLPPFTPTNASASALLSRRETLAWVEREAAWRKASRLVVYVAHVTLTATDAVLLTKDPTGQMLATLHVHIFQYVVKI